MSITIELYSFMKDKISFNILILVKYNLLKFLKLLNNYVISLNN